MRRIRVVVYGLLIIAIIVGFLLPGFAAWADTDAMVGTEEVSPSPSPSPSAAVSGPVASPVITELQVADTDEFVELYNPTDDALPLTGLLLQYRGGGATVTTLVNLDVYTIAPKQFAVFGHIAGRADITANFSTMLNNSKGEVFIANASAPSTALDKVAWGDVSTSDGYFFDSEPAAVPPAGNSLQRCFKDGELQYSDPRDTSQEFKVYTNDLPTPFVGMACAAAAPSATLCTGIVINEIGANLSDQFIELHNPTDAAVPLAGCQLQTNRSSKTYLLTQEILEAGAYLSILVSDTGLTLTKTTSGTVYLLTSDGQVEVDTQNYSNLAEDTSWSRFDDSWRQTYAVTAGDENIYEQYLPCDEGYYRNTDTGRCNKVPVEDPLTLCGPGQYRSLETNRCRNITAASVQVPCREGQYRSPVTHRCRNVATASVRKPCKDNQYRSEATNRCRNLPAATVPDAAFAVQPVKDSGTTFVGWWALGGVLLLAIIYAVLEWRREFMATWQKVIQRFK